MGYLTVLSSAHRLLGTLGGRGASNQRLFFVGVNMSVLCPSVPVPLVPNGRFNTLHVILY